MIEKTAVNKKTKKKRYRVRIFSSGQQVAMRTFDKSGEAKTWEAEQKRALQLGEWTDPRASLKTLGKVIAEFNDARHGTVAPHTWATDEANLRVHVPVKLQRLPMSSINRARLDALWGELLRKRARGTVARVRNSVSSLMAYALVQGYIGHNPVLLSRLPKGIGDVKEQSVVRPFSDAELIAVIEAATAVHAPYGALVEFAALTGLRWGELRGLRVSDIVTFSGYSAVLVTRSHSDGFAPKGPKSGKPRSVPLVPRAEALLNELNHGRRGSDLVFTAPRGGAIHGRNFFRSVGWDALTEHVFHDLRHTAATRWINSGVSPKTTSHWLGHSELSTTLRIYVTFFSGEQDRAGLAKLVVCPVNRYLFAG